MVASSRLDMPSHGLVGEGSGNFAYSELPNAKGVPISRNSDSEYKILDNIADKLGNNTGAKGSITIVSERPACGSCLGVVDQFHKRYPNIDVKVFDNTGVLLSPLKKSAEVR